jgi:snurportin-1
LDCIFHEADATYYIVDVMCWKGYSLYDCTTEFRLFWRDTKLREEEGAVMGRSEESRYSFQSVPAYPCTSGTTRLFPEF